MGEQPEPVDPAAETAAAMVPPPIGSTYVLDGRGGMVESAAPPGRRGFQLVVLPSSPADCGEWLTAAFGQVTAEALLEADPRPHCTAYDEGALIALTIVPVSDRADLKNQREAAFWVEKGRVVAVTDLAVDELLGVSPERGKGSAPTTPVHVVMRAALRAADRLEPMLDALSDKADDLEEEVLRAPNDRTRVGLNVVRHSAIMLRRTILPQRDALTTLETAAYSWFTQRDRSRLREAVGWMNRLAQEIGNFTERAALVHDQIMDRRAEQLNRALLILAAVTVVLMPLTVISGMLGMNVAGIPFADSPWAFGAVCLFLVILGLLLALWMRKRKWL